VGCLRGAGKEDMYNMLAEASNRYMAEQNIKKASNKTVLTGAGSSGSRKMSGTEDDMQVLEALKLPSSLTYGTLFGSQMHRLPVGIYVGLHILRFRQCCK